MSHLLKVPPPQHATLRTKLPAPEPLVDTPNPYPNHSATVGLKRQGVRLVKVSQVRDIAVAFEREMY